MHIWEMSVGCHEILVTNVQVHKHTVTTELGNLQNSILLGSIVLTKADIEVNHISTECTRCAECSVLLATLRVPIGEAVAVKASSACNLERRSELIALTEVVVVVETLIKETNA